jgi:hypothetical protein
MNLNSTDRALRKIRLRNRISNQSDAVGVKVDVGREPVWQWLVQGGTGGSKQLTTEGKVADQARPNGLRSTDFVSLRRMSYSAKRPRRFLKEFTSLTHLTDPPVLSECKCLHETNGTAVSLGPHVVSRGITHPHTGHRVNKRWERPIPISVSANKTQNLVVLYPSARWRPTTGHSTLSIVPRNKAFIDSMSFGACA